LGNPGEAGVPQKMDAQKMDFADWCYELAGYACRSKKNIFGFSNAKKCSIA
jgi:hypothetical protein